MLVKERYHHTGPESRSKFLDNPRQFICGVEYEIEDIRGHGDATEFLQVKEDHSLRNNGYEYVTFPLSYESSLNIFKELHGTLLYGKEAFTHRTSIHVHVNVCSLELSELKQFILLYALTEPLFFNFVGKQRESSIYCVPLSHTYLTSHYKRSAEDLVLKWHKYTAFNILPVQTQGSVEFRHLYGTNNFEVFELWLSSIKSLYDFVINTPKFNLLKEMGNIETIVRQCAPLLLAKGDMSLLKNSILDVKLAGV